MPSPAPFAESIPPDSNLTQAKPAPVFIAGIPTATGVWVDFADGPRRLLPGQVDELQALGLEIDDDFRADAKTVDFGRFMHNIGDMRGAAFVQKAVGGLINGHFKKLNERR